MDTADPHRARGWEEGKRSQEECSSATRHCEAQGARSLLQTHAVVEPKEQFQPFCYLQSCTVDCSLQP